MQKMAVFVEGQTEQTFVARLVREIAGAHQLQIETQKAVGKRGRRVSYQVYATPSFPDVRFYVLIVDSSGDATVVSDICDQYESLRSSGFSRIVGLRDVYPIPRAGVQRLEHGIQNALAFRIPRALLPVQVVLAVMEIEAWFIAEHRHFAKIAPSITDDRVRRKLGFHPSSAGIDKVEEIKHPSKKLDEIYQLGGRRYRKRKREARRTVNALDCDHLYLEVRHRVTRLGALIHQLNAFLAQDGD